MNITWRGGGAGELFCGESFKVELDVADPKGALELFSDNTKGPWLELRAGNSAQMAHKDAWYRLTVERRDQGFEWEGKFGPTDPGEYRLALVSHDGFIAQTQSITVRICLSLSFLCLSDALTCASVQSVTFVVFLPLR